jgi:hypothetical protein
MSVGLTVPQGADLTALLRECGFGARMEVTGGDGWDIRLTVAARHLTITTPKDHVLTDVATGVVIARGDEETILAALSTLREGTPT